MIKFNKIVNKKSKNLVFISLFLLLTSMFYVSASLDTIMRLSSDSNSHGESYLGDGNYPVEINHFNIFSWQTGNVEAHLCEPLSYSNAVVRLSSESNAHAQVPKEESCVGEAVSCGNYDTLFGTDHESCLAHEGCEVDEEYIDECVGIPVFCGEYNSESNCNSQEGCVWLNVPQEELIDYQTRVCYDEMICRASNSSKGCYKENEKCVVKLSDWTNAHLETCDNDNYEFEICCKSNVDCEVFASKSTCLGYEECTWTPPTPPEQPIGEETEGGCCLKGYRWNNNSQSCEQTFGDGLCTLPVSQALVDPGHLSIDNSKGPIRYENGEYSYCAQVSSDLNYGYWYPVESY